MSRSPSSVAAGIKRSGIREIMNLAAQQPDAIHLEVGEPAFDTPAHVRAAAEAAARDGFTRYTANKGLPEVRASIARKLARRNQLEVSPEQIVVTCGAVNGIMAAYSALLDPGDAALIPDPAWPNYEMMILARHAVPVRYSLVPETGFQPDLDQIERLAATTPSLKAILVNSPSNPTGTIVSTAALERIVEIARAHDLYVIADDVYEDMVFDGPPGPIAASMDRDERVVSAFSLSKSYAMTGWRVGYVVARQDLADLIEKMQEAVISCASSVSQKAAQAAIDGDQACVEEMRRAYAERRDIAVDVLGRAGMLVARPTGAFYAMADVSATGMSGTDFARRLLLDHGVAVAPGEAFGPGGAGMVRISLAPSRASLETGLDRLVGAARRWSPGAGGRI
ncbi:MAG TPA: aminotransferase class I/II-fold pyridoxal phosphate-dependent enzyme [Kofleriaceae bacterium]|nr:aminotransferase class I/II-fold pyridoxal phosphate-dependent enzyme [Kofleriaceae bacterium]